MNKNEVRRWFGNVNLSLVLLTLQLFFSINVWAQSPTLSSVAPNKAGVGTSVTITGTNFNTTTSGNIVRFGATKGSVTSASATSLTVTVDSGANFNAISVCNTSTHLTGYEDSAFSPTFANTYFDTGINFKWRFDISVGSGPFIAAIGDMDEDGKPDLVVASKNDSKIYLLRNISAVGHLDSPSFGPPIGYSVYNQPTSVKLVDIDGDGHLDVVATDVGGYKLSAFHNSSSPGSLSLAARVDFSTIPAAAPYVVAVVDLDGDGWPELITTAAYSDEVTVFHNNGIYGSISSSSFGSPVNFATGSFPIGLAVADIDGDGKPDILTADSAGHAISVLRNTSTTGTLSTSSFATHADILTGATPIDVAVADIDGDGKPDVIVSNNSVDSIVIFRNTSSSGTISFAGKVSFASAIYPTGLVVTDFDGDGKPDIVSTTVAPASATYGLISVFRNTALAGTIDASSLAPYNTFSVGGWPFGVTAGDLDGDGYPEVVTANYTNDDISILKNYPLPHVGRIVGDTSFCFSGLNDTATFTDATAGGTWSVFNTSVATVTAGGLVTAHAQGTDTLYYTVVAGGDTNYAYRVLIVDTTAHVSVISGPSYVCTGSHVTLTDTAHFGSWSSSSGAVASINATTGVATGSTPGTVTITYTKTTACNTADTTRALIVYASSPAAGTISGPSTFCAGDTATYSDTASGGTWSVTNSHASVSGTGFLTAVSAGTDTVVYTVSNPCATAVARKIITVNPAPNAGSISGPSGVCAGSAISLSETSGSGTWGATNGHATVTGSGSVSGVTTGTDTITYSVTNSCGTAVATHVVSVITVGSGGAIGGSATVCIGSTDTLSAAPAGGTWASSNGLIATITPAGVVTGHATGYDTITYSVSYSCGTAVSTLPIAVNTVPMANVITGQDSVCSGATISLSDTASGGSWGSLNAAVATVSVSGVVTGHSADTTTITYIINNGCGNTVTGLTVDVRPLPYVGPITGTGALCVSAPGTTLSDAVPGGAWSSSDLAVAQIDTGGVVTIAGAGTDTIHYLLTNGCGTSDSIKVLIVSPMPVAGTISGAANVCVASTITLSDTATGGVWSVYSTTVASVSATGVVTGHLVGTDTVYYTVTNACGTAIAKKVITVSPSADAGTIGGTPALCVGAHTLLSDTVSGGTWSSEDTAVAQVASDGTVTGITSGTTHISYTVSGTCGSTSATILVTVGTTNGSGTIAGAAFVCTGASITLTDTTASGTWSAQNGAATVTGGVVAGITAGTDTIYYTITNTCGSSSASKVIEIKPHPAVAPITGPVFVCTGAGVLLSDVTAGGTWSISPASLGIATINGAGYLAGDAAGSAIISYSVSDSFCSSVVTDTITVRQKPALTSPLTAPAICDSTRFFYQPVASISGATFAWTRGVTSGISNTAASGSDTISETLNSTIDVPVNVGYLYVVAVNGCSDTQQVMVTVNPTPALTSALADTVCGGTPINYIPQSSVAVTTFVWTRGVTAGVLPVTGSGSGIIAEALDNTTTTGIDVVYIFTLTAAGCGDTADVHVLLEPAATAPVIATNPPSVICDGVMYQNFGAASVPAPGVQYAWTTAGGAQVWATGNTEQYCLVNFETPGINWVFLTATIGGNNCIARDSFAVSVTLDHSDQPEVLRTGNNFVCIPDNEESYQWGYDDAQTLDSTMIPHETDQAYYEPDPDYAHKYYWVMTTSHDGCQQKTYYLLPTSVATPSKENGTMDVYPNPNNGTFMVRVNSAVTTNVHVELTNATGQKVQRFDMPANSTREINLSVPAGVYYLHAVAGDADHVQKIVVE